MTNDEVIRARDLRVGDRLTLNGAPGRVTWCRLSGATVEFDLLVRGTPTRVSLSADWELRVTREAGR
jgi:hypothetical protein